MILFPLCIGLPGKLSFLHEIRGHGKWAADGEPDPIGCLRESFSVTRSEQLVRLCESRLSMNDKDRLLLNDE